MGEENINIWKRKLDWIVQHGGMALLITHPDYINIEGPDCPKGGYQLRFYGEFLKYIKEKYQDQFWNPKPREISKFWSKNYSNEKRPINSRLRVCMLAYSFYQSDSRVIRYADTLIRRGEEVDVISLKKSTSPSYEKLRGVSVYGIQERVYDEKSQFVYLYRVMKFFVKSAFLLTMHQIRRPYDIIHVHNIPDFLVFATIIPKILGAKVILDIHDIVPELYAAKFGVNHNSILFKLLATIEKASYAYSDQVIISNHLWEKTLISRSVKNGKCSVIMNYPDNSIFYRRDKEKDNDKIIIIYPGSFNWHQGVDIAIKSFNIIKDEAPKAEFHIYGAGDQRELLATLVQELGLQNRVFIKDFLSIDQIAEVMANADFGVVPKRNDSFGGEAFSTKILEFMSLGVPVIVSRTKIDSYYFNDSVVKFFKAGDVEDLSTAMLEMIRNPDLRMTLAQNALKFVEEFSWDKKKSEYLDLVDRLTSKKC